MLASKLKEMREARGMGQKEVAKILGGSQSKISAIENGERSLDIETFIRFCDIYSTNANYLLSGEYPKILSEPPKDGEEQKPPEKPNAEQRCLDLYDKLVAAQEREHAALLRENSDLRALGERQKNEIEDLKRQLTVALCSKKSVY